MVVFLNESIRVGVVFKDGRVFPCWFDYRGRKITVREVAYTWRQKAGNIMRLHFAVTDGANVYDLAFQPEQLTWRLEAVEEAGP